MFKMASFENELFHSMEKTLVKSQIEQKHGFDRLAKAADYLNIAAEIFEKAGMTEEASEVTAILQQLTDRLSSKTSSL
jgi:hypothetical protein